jgi:hypothetical protein
MAPSSTLPGEAQLVCPNDGLVQGLFGMLRSCQHLADYQQPKLSQLHCFGG